MSAFEDDAKLFNQKLDEYKSLLHSNASGSEIFNKRKEMDVLVRKLQEDTGLVDRPLIVGKEIRGRNYRKESPLDKSVGRNASSPYKEPSKAWQTKEGIYSPDYPQGERSKTPRAKIDTSLRTTQMDFPLEKTEQEEEIKARTKSNATEKKLNTAEEKALRLAQSKQMVTVKSTAKGQDIIDNFLMGNGKYNKKVAAAIKTPEDARKVFAEVERRKREPSESESVALEKKVNKAIEEAGGIRQYRALQKASKRLRRKKAILKLQRIKRAGRKEISIPWLNEGRALNVRKANKPGTSPIGSIGYHIFYPVHRKKKARW